MVNCRTVSKVITALFCASVSVVAQSAPPRIFFTDLVSGPKTGGENNNGAFVTLYGNNFGTSPKVTVGGGAALITRAPAPHLWYQKLVIQLGPNAATGNIVVTGSNGTSNGMPFTVRNGNIRFVGTQAGDQSTMVACKNSLAPGDICYVRNGVKQTGVDDYDGTLDIHSAGTVAMPKAIIAYPGAVVTVDSGVNAIRVASLDIDGSNWVFAGLTLRADASAVDTAKTTDNWRLIGNDMSCPGATGDAWASCLHAEETNNMKVLGNYVHDSRIGNRGPTKGYHEMYFTTDNFHVEVGWNEIKGGGSCRGLQFHSSLGVNHYDLDVHDNYIHDTHCDGMNFATIDPSKGPVKIYNNVVARAGTGVEYGDLSSYTCLYIASGGDRGPSGAGTVEVFNNTFYNCGPAGGSTASAINKADPDITVNFNNNIVSLLSGQKYLTLSAGTLRGSNNIWYGAGSAPSQTTGNLTTDPKFVGPASSNFHLLSDSPAIDAGMTAAVTWDRDGNIRPSNGKFDIGAYESGSGSAPTGSPCDLTGTDGKIDNADITSAKNRALGTEACSDGDLDQNGRCDVVDVQRVINASLGAACRQGQ